MHLTPREMDKLLVLTLGEVARRRKERGLKLNHPEAVAFITSAALDEARAGKTVEEVMNMARKVLTRADVMEGVPEMIPFVQLEAVFTDGSRLVTVHSPIN
ncbi:MAG: urease subunit gamma [Mailhella sp.]|jgi:urease subunit gamma|nr:urease subunit gamma [Mailhella sp.]